MKRYFSHLLLLLLIGYLIFIFRSSFIHFFYADDFFHIILSRGQSLLEAFNIFAPAAREYYIYRPLTTQLFWTLGELSFGLNPFPYHLVNFFFFSLNIVLVFFLGKKLTTSSRKGALAAIIYGLSASNFYRLYFLSTFQDTVMATAALATLLLYIRNSRWFLVTLILGLTAKETAVTIPGILIVYEVFFRRKFSPRLVVACLLSVGYFLAHKYFFGFYQGGIYQYQFHPISVVSNYVWYLLWALGLPESFVDTGSFVRVLTLHSETLAIFGLIGKWILFLFMAVLGTLAISTVLWLKKRDHLKVVLLGSSIFFLLVLPVAFFPFHKFAINLAGPLIGLALVLAVVVKKPLTAPLIVLLTVLLAFTVTFNETNHWTYQRGEIARKAIIYLKDTYPGGIANKTIYFRNGAARDCTFIPHIINPSDQVAFSLAYADGVKVFYPNQNVKVIFEDIDKGASCNSTVETIDSRKLLHVRYE